MEEPGCSMCLSMNDDKLNLVNGLLQLQIAILREDKVLVEERILLVQLWLRQMLLQDIFMITEKILIYEKFESFNSIVTPLDIINVIPQLFQNNF